MSSPAGDPMTDAERFRADRDRLRIEAAAFLLEWFGERCPDRVAGCEVCERWASLDRLLADPFTGHESGAGP